MVTCSKGILLYVFFLLKFKKFLGVVLWHPRQCRRYTCRDRSVKHLFSSDVIDQSVCRMLRNHIGHICNVCQMVPNVNVVDMVRANILWKLVILTLIGMRQNNFWIGFCHLNFYQKFPNIFGGAK